MGLSLARANDISSRFFIRCAIHGELKYFNKQFLSTEQISVTKSCH